MGRIQWLSYGNNCRKYCWKWNLTREEQDAFAADSQAKAAKAVADGKFKDEIVPVVIPQRKGDPIVFDTDEYVRPELQLKVG